MEPDDTSPRPGSAVHLRGAVALLGRFPALAGVDLDVEARSVVLLRGPNGAGKTTLLRLLAGLVPVNAGVATVLGTDLVADRRAVRRRVGLLAQGAALYDDLTVEDNVRFWTRACGASEHDAEAAMTALGVDGRLRTVRVSRLSTGQRRRTSLACIAARRPELWLLDEPHAGLDAEGRDVVDALVRDAVSAGATVVLSSHELDRSMDLADRVVHLVTGVVRSVDGGDHDAA